MRYMLKKIYTWLLILIMAISAVQGAAAFDFNQNKKGQECQLMQMSLSDDNNSGADGNCPIKHGENNGFDNECITPCDFSSLQDPHATRLGIGANSQKNILTGGDTILSHHPELLQRPPKA